MALEFNCNNCGMTIHVRYIAVGEEATCRNCGAKQLVPADHIIAADKPKFAPTPQNQDVGFEDYLQTQVDDLLASRWKRLLAHVVDVLILISIFVITIFLFKPVSPEPGLSKRQEFLALMSDDLAAILSLIGILYAIVQGSLLVRRGQSIGKLIFGTKIVMLDNSHPAWWRLIILRPLIPYIAWIRPTQQWTDASWALPVELAFKLLGAVDALFIFTTERRTLHDLVAGTKVVDKSRFYHSKERASSANNMES